jgi:hypothetical protein
MEPKKKGRTPQGKKWISFSLDQEIVLFIKNLPDGDRSKFVNDILARGIASLKGTNHEVQVQETN